MQEPTDRQEAILRNAWKYAQRYLSEFGPGITLVKVRPRQTHIYEAAYLPKDRWNMGNAVFSGVTDDPYTTNRVMSYDPNTEYLVVIIEKKQGKYANGIMASHEVPPETSNTPPSPEEAERQAGELAVLKTGMAVRMFQMKGPGLLILRQKAEIITGQFFTIEHLAQSEHADERWLLAAERTKSGKEVAIYVAQEEWEHGYMLMLPYNAITSWEGVDVTPSTLRRDLPYTPKRASGWSKEFVTAIAENAAGWAQLHGAGVVAVRGIPRYLPALLYVPRECIPDPAIWKEVEDYDSERVVPTVFLYPDGAHKLRWLDIHSQPPGLDG